MNVKFNPSYWPFVLQNFFTKIVSEFDSYNIGYGPSTQFTTSQYCRSFKVSYRNVKERISKLKQACKQCKRYIRYNSTIYKFV